MLSGAFSRIRHEPSTAQGIEYMNKLILHARETDTPADSPVKEKPQETAAAPQKTIPLLGGLTHPSQVGALSHEALEQLAGEVRARIIDTTSKNGGHLAPSLGVVELTLAMLSVFNPADDKIIWDVGHQAYAYKLLTGRADVFHTLRQHGGISGFPSPAESPFDHFGVGHSSTSISAALGMAVARDLAGENHHVISVIGDGSMTAGLAFEGFNQAGSMGRRLIVILNDNEMSIAKNVGALSLFMSRNLSARWVRKVKKELEYFLKSIPTIGDDLYEIARRSKHSFKNFFTPGILFEAMRFNYIGAVDGHNIQEMQQVLRLAMTLEKPVLIHVLTRKGKGYLPAEENPMHYHGVGRFEPSTGAFTKTAAPAKSYTEVFGSTLCDMARKDSRVVAITAAMPEGTGLAGFAQEFPARFFDVGICEQHAVTFAAGLATQGFRPVVSIYSTFMQRSYDQIVHDVCLQNLPVTLCLDRAGLVGEDGATHQGVFDISYLRHIPNMVCFAPKDEAELQQGLVTALANDGPFALRYPRGPGAGVELCADPQPIPVGHAEYLCKANTGVAVIAIGSRVHPALLAAQQLLAEEGLACTVLNARWIKPLPETALKEIALRHDKWLLVEEHVLAGGFSSAVIELLNDAGLMRGKQVERLGIPDLFVEHGAAPLLQERLGLDVQGIKTALRALCRKEKKCSRHRTEAVGQ